MNLIEHWGSGIPRIIDKVKASGLQEPEFIGGEVDLRINIYRGQVDTNNANSTKNGANGVKCGADDGTNGTEVPLNKEQTQIEKSLQIIENFHHFAWLVAFTNSSQKNSTHILIMEVDFCPVLCIPEVPVLQAFRGISHFVWYCKAVSDLS